jgi:hypothetical protein
MHHAASQGKRRGNPDHHRNGIDAEAGQPLVGSAGGGATLRQGELQARVFLIS